MSVSGDCHGNCARAESLPFKTVTLCIVSLVSDNCLINYLFLKSIESRDSVSCA